MRSTVSTQAGDRSFASREVVKTMVIALQTAAIILIVLNLPPLLAQVSDFPLWWTICSVMAVIAPSVAILASQRRVEYRALKMLCGIQAIAMLTCLALVPVALQGTRLSLGAGAPWLTELSVIAGAAAGVRWGWRGTALYGLGLQATLFLLVFVSSGDLVPGQALNDAVFGVFYVTLFSALAVTLARAGTELDVAVVHATQEARGLAMAAASRAATHRVESLIHDRIIVALLSYSNPSVSVGVARLEAQRAISAIASVGQEEPLTDLVPIDLVWTLQSLTTEADPEITFDYRIEGSTAIPIAIARSMAGAAAEALRNTMNHAGASSVTREMRVSISEDVVEIFILDDGSGFDPNSIPPSRLGVRQGILERMAAVRGGSAEVTSSAGYGTVVAVRWRR